MKTIKELFCNKCGWKWFPRIMTKPIKCPNCQTKKWGDDGKADKAGD
jgi:predicted Zn-ribbon and HTH transcriptional regulator